MSVGLSRVDLPDFGQPAEFPAIPVHEYQERIDAAVSGAAAEGMDALVVYADREHAANQEYLCGVGPRFEESLLVLTRHGQRTLLVGNECQAYGPPARLGIEMVLYQDFSPPGQQRDSVRSLAEVLNAAGIGAGTVVGCVGWKSLTPGFVPEARHALEIPSFIADTIRAAVREPTRVVNANHLFAAEGTGARLTNSVDQIAQFEYAATVTSTSVRDALHALQPGVTERDIEAAFTTRGLPLSCHTMVSFGEKVRRGLSSPSDRRAGHGDAFMICQGLQGALTCRGGIVASGSDDTSASRMFEPLARNYFDVIAAWYEHVRVDALAGEVFDAVNRVRRDDLFSFLLPPGHHLHIEEWAQSSFREGNTTVLSSGAVLQSDIIPVAKGPFRYANLEDGIVLADEHLRSAIRDWYPDMWRRMQARRSFMRDAIGIDIDDSVLPLGNTPAWYPPFGLTPSHILVRG
jgi:hypothetical protein